MIIVVELCYKLEFKAKSGRAVAVGEGGRRGPLPSSYVYCN